MAKKEKIKDAKKIIGKIEIEVEEVPERTMYLNQHFGNGTLGKVEFDASHTLPDMSLLVTVNKKRYKVSSQSIITGMIDLITPEK